MNEWRASGSAAQAVCQKRLPVIVEGIGKVVKWIRIQSPGGSADSVTLTTRVYPNETTTLGAQVHKRHKRPVVNTRITSQPFMGSVRPSDPSCCVGASHLSGTRPSSGPCQIKSTITWREGLGERLRPPSYLAGSSYRSYGPWELMFLGGQ